MYYNCFTVSQCHTVTNINTRPIIFNMSTTNVTLQILENVSKDQQKVKSQFAFRLYPEFLDAARNLLLSQHDAENGVTVQSKINKLAERLVCEYLVNSDPEKFTKYLPCYEQETPSETENREPDPVPEQTTECGLSGPQEGDQSGHL